MSARTWAVAPLVGAVIALAAPTAAHAGTAAVPARHAATAATVHPTAGGHPARRNRLGGGGFPGCPSIKVALSSDRTAVLSNCRRGPVAVILTSDNKVDAFLDVNYPTDTTDGLELRIIGFFRPHPALLVKYFDSAPRWYYFPPSRYHYG
ncbi:hypothetical protein ACFOSC_13090 [Streptantibioticus rubrisoli]|uniref:Uncharacterized protein n=1 Tax=Streptantibioticus rubrisoli TaxID=1387313 RepID=A0ABT1P7V5_9ACTN|nr:hypothetical protein [Streptantibioticus rubrisoli]MCQ4041435.1 hypothetical protein [Streptantibioticus rubrisoli]